MKSDKLTNNDIADALISVNTEIGNCDEKTALGFKTSKKKKILKSQDDKSFSRFTHEIIKRQSRKD